MRIVICDDEEAVRNVLAARTEELCPDAEVLCCESGEKLLTMGLEADILFLDIQMPGQNGMETAKKLRDEGWKSIIIFVTAIEEYVFQSFDVGAFHYLVKPFTDEKFKSVLHSAVNQYRERHHSLMDQKNASMSSQDDRFLLIKSKGTHTKIFWKDIVYAEVLNRKVTIHKMKEDIEYYGRLSELEKQAGEDFFRSHRSYLVHFKYVVKYNASSIIMENGTALMAKQNYPQFVKSYLKYNQRRGKDRHYGEL